MLVDAGPLIAAAVKRDRYHRAAVNWFRSHRAALLFTTLPALTEACHALPEQAQVKLLRLAAPDRPALKPSPASWRPRATCS